MRSRCCANDLREGAGVTSVSMRVNGADVRADVEDRTLLVHFLREHLRLTGTHVGCDTSQCGACTIHLNGEAVKSCTMFAAQADGDEIVTIEGVGEPGRLHSMQAAFQQHHALQCGFCTPGMIMAGIDILRRHKSPDEETIREELEGNLCRCTGYVNIVKAIKAAAES
ncbi:MAG: (2Fe-2S)-binding protein [Hyphomonadaceae bacterium]|nr:(2Fe-2S)-binding protein [Hyphomonadaceae bacterium]